MKIVATRTCASPSCLLIAESDYEVVGTPYRGRRKIGPLMSTWSASIFTPWRCVDSRSCPLLRGAWPVYLCPPGKLNRFRIQTKGMRLHKPQQLLQCRNLSWRTHLSLCALRRAWNSATITPTRFFRLFLHSIDISESRQMNIRHQPGTLHRHLWLSTVCRAYTPPGNPDHGQAS